MKAPSFDYARPASLAETFALMSRHGDDARILAGGQTLLATLNMRLSEPALLIDITRVDALKGLSLATGADGADVLRIGALVTHREIEESDVVARHAPLLTMAAPQVAHRAIRNRGTFGGSIAFADPAAEWPACLVALDGVVVVEGPGGERRIAADDFFVGLYTTALEPDELITACEIPIATDAHACRFDELARRHGDYAIVGLAIARRRDGADVASIRLAYLGVATVPFRPRRTEALLTGRTLDDGAIATAVDALRDELDPMGDLTNSGETKRHLGCVLAGRMLRELV